MLFLDLPLITPILKMSPRYEYCFTIEADFFITRATNYSHRYDDMPITRVFDTEQILNWFRTYLKNNEVYQAYEPIIEHLNDEFFKITFYTNRELSDGDLYHVAKSFSDPANPDENNINNFYIFGRIFSAVVSC